ncbi:uncharacterized protein LOC120174777 [Hibiscus syriacus]|uniref:uncharacterized protein LOC120174777 n=1 Tax=Hibiscus syriacus TaxID=106335 RepID=UPI00192386BA|nr:uncharacterized protein LOC120174777 [Hibiscus syriacus]
MIMKLQREEIMLVGNHPSLVSLRVLQQMQIVVSPLHLIQTVVSLNPWSSSASHLNETFQVGIASCPNLFTPCPFPWRLLPQKPRTPQLRGFQMIQPHHKEMPIAGAVLAAAMILRIFLSHLNL